MFRGTISPARLRTFSCPTWSAERRNRPSAWSLTCQRAAEFVEIVDVERAEIDLQRVEDVADGHAHRLGLGAIDVGEELRRVRAEQGEQRRPGPVADWPRAIRRVGHLLERGQPDVAAVFDHDLEAAGGAESVDRRRSEDAHYRLGNLLVADLPQCGGDGLVAIFRRMRVRSNGLRITNIEPKFGALACSRIDCRRRPACAPRRRSSGLAVQPGDRRPGCAPRTPPSGNCTFTSR